MMPALVQVYTAMLNLCGSKYEEREGLYVEPNKHLSQTHSSDHCLWHACWMTAITNACSIAGVHSHDGPVREQVQGERGAVCGP